ncbi:hypothetical protein [Shewanella indica]|uniref:hypothetical protein n=1 Tax=Shewanella indica TaxID=768528 RepID=UPI00399AEE21
MKHKSLIVASLLLCLGGCDWLDDDDDPVVPPTPEPGQSVSINEAESLKVALSAVDPQSQALTFSLTTAEGKPVKDAGSNYVVMYLKMPAEQVSAFSMSWHKGARFECSETVDTCAGTMEALETEGQYRFTPEGLEELNQTEGELKLAVILTGAKAQSAPELISAP